MMIYSSSDEEGHLTNLEGMFEDTNEYIYLIEELSSHQWLLPDHEWTDDQNAALQFKNFYKAIQYGKDNGIENFIVIVFELPE